MTNQTCTRLPVDALVLLAVSLTAAIGIWPRPGESIVSFLWPSLIIGLLGMLSAARLVVGLREQRSSSSAEPEHTGETVEAPVLGGSRWFIVLYFSYVFTLHWFGFYVGTPLFLGLFIFRLSQGVCVRTRLTRALVCGSAMLALITLVFAYVFSLHLPMGQGAFRLFNEHIVYLPYRFM